MDISTGLKQSRILAGMKQGVFANKAGISQTYVSQIESGKKVPSVEVIGLYAKITKQPLAVILWKSLTVSDVQKGKKTEFEKIKPIVDELIDSMFSEALIKSNKSGGKHGR